MGTFTKHERNLIKRIMERKHIVRNTNQEFDDQLTFGQRVADKVVTFQNPAGNWDQLSQRKEPGA